MITYRASSSLIYDNLMSEREVFPEICQMTNYSEVILPYIGIQSIPHLFAAVPKEFSEIS